MALQIRRSGDPLAEQMANAYNLFKREVTESLATYPHADITSLTTGDQRPPGMLTATQLSIAGTTTNLALVLALAESARFVMLTHYDDDVAHKAVDAANGDAISYAALAPLSATTAAMPATKTGSGATYAAVTADNTLVLNLNGREHIITFAGTENSGVTFRAAINAAIGTPGGKAPGLARASSTQTMLVANPDQSGIAYGSVVSGDTDVLASLGLTVGAFTPVTVVATPTQDQADTLLEALVTSITAHLVQSGVHFTNDTTNAFGTTAAVDLPSSKLRAADVKSVGNLHIAFSFTSPSIKLIDA
jgi:hypothetical protein